MDENKFKKIVEEVVNKAVDPIKKTLKDHTRSMEQVLSEVKATHDEIGLWHQRDKREINEIKKHLDLPIILDIP